MPAIRERGEGFAKRRERLAQLKRGPGTFVYDGSGCDTEMVPTPLLAGRDEPVLDDSGMPVIDASGRQVFRKAGTYVRDTSGNIVLGGVPKIVRKPIEVFVLQDVRFPTGEPVLVTSASLALKLRGMSCFEELTEGDAPRKRGRKPRSEAAEPADNESEAALE